MKSVSLLTLQSLLWVCSLTTCLGLGHVIYKLEETGYQRQIKAALTATSSACEEIAKRFHHAEEEKTFGPEKRVAFQSALLEIVLAHYEGVEGGFWSAAASQPDSFTTYAFPTYEGSGSKRDVPDAEKTLLLKVMKQALENGKSAASEARGVRSTTLAFACPVGPNESAWTLQRLQLSSIAAYDQIKTLLLLTIVFILFSATLCSFLLKKWSRDLAAMAIASENGTQFPEARNAELNRISQFTNSNLVRIRGLEKQNLSQTEKLSRSDRLRTLGELSSGIAHDLRNPLSTLRLKLENLLVDPAVRAPRSAPVLFEQIDHLDRMIDMILAMTKPFDLKKERVDLAAWLEKVLERLRTLAEKKSIALKVELSATHGFFDALQMGRALNNLLENAIAFTPIEGTVCLSITSQGSKLLFRIEDSGKGIDESLVDKLFQPFSSHRAGGIGLGLVMAKEIIEAHGGTVASIGSQTSGSQSTGAIFKLEIPL